MLKPYSSKAGYKASAILLFATASWGFTFPLIKNAVASISPFAFVFIRFLVAAIVLLPLVVRDFKNSSIKLVTVGIVLGLINSAIYTTQAIGLETISSAQAAFIVGLNVLFIPLLSPAFKLGKIRIIDVAASLIYLVGLLIFTDFTLQNQIANLWCLLSAFAIAISIVFLQAATVKSDTQSYKLLAFYQIIFTIPISLVLSPHVPYQKLLKIEVISSLLFCAIFATVIALLLQVRYQRFVTTTRAALIYSLEPVFACIFGLLLNREIIGIRMILGGIVMLTSLMLQICLENKFNFGRYTEDCRKQPIDHQLGGGVD